MRLLIRTFFILITFAALGSTHASPPRVPSFQQDFANHITSPDSNNPEHTTERVYDLNIDSGESLEHNIRQLFYPNATGQGGTLWEYIRIIGVAIFFVFLVSIGIQFMMNGDDDSKLSEARQHIMWLLYGAFLYFGAVWVLGIALKIDGGGGSTALVKNFQDNLRFQLLAFFKALAFFAAILATFVAGYRMMQAMGEDSKIQEARTGALNVLYALIILKIIDFIYLLAMDNTFFDEARVRIIKVSRILGYVIGIAILASIFVAGFQYITDGGSGDGAKKAKTTLTNVFVASMTIFLFLLITYQVIAQFG